MQKMSAEDVHQLAMSPLYVLYLVASAHVAPGWISERQIVRAIEYGLKGKTALSEEIFDLLRSNLHEFYADFPHSDNLKSRELWHAGVQSLKQLLDRDSVSKDFADDFKGALAGLAQFVAEGGAFRQKLQDESMQRRVEWIKETLGYKNL